MSIMFNLSKLKKILDKNEESLNDDDYIYLINVRNDCDLVFYNGQPSIPNIFYDKTNELLEKKNLPRGLGIEILISRLKNNDKLFDEIEDLEKKFSKSSKKNLPRKERKDNHLSQKFMGTLKNIKKNEKH